MVVSYCHGSVQRRTKRKVALRMHCPTCIPHLSSTLSRFSSVLISSSSHSFPMLSCCCWSRFMPFATVQQHCNNVRTTWGDVLQVHVRIESLVGFLGKSSEDFFSLTSVFSTTRLLFWSLLRPTSMGLQDFHQLWHCGCGCFMLDATQWPRPDACIIWASPGCCK